MDVRRFSASIEAARRKLRALDKMAGDAGATAHERATAAALKARLEQRLRKAGVPEGDWTDGAYRLGRWAKAIAKSAAPETPKGDWTDHAFRLGKVLGRRLKRRPPQ